LGGDKRISDSIDVISGKILHVPKMALCIGENSNMLVEAVEARAVISGDGAAPTINTVSVAPPAAHQVQVELRASGICHTDIHSIHWPGRQIMGHEGAGVVRAVGEGVTRFKAGDRVMLNWAIPCGHCSMCEHDLPALCPIEAQRHGPHPMARPAPEAAIENGKAIGRMFNLGTMAEVMLVDEAAVTAIPDDLDFTAACIIGCAVMTGAGSVWNIAQVKMGQSVVVIGCGSVGVNIIQAAKGAGATTIIAIDRSEAALAKAEQFGATHKLAAEDIDELATKVRAITGPGADHAFESTGILELAFAPLKLIRMGGTAIQVSGFNAAPSLPVVELPPFLWNKSYMAALYGGCIPDRDFPRIFDATAQGNFELASQITRVWDFDQALDALATADKEGGKHVITYKVSTI
jgi:S-(hydroxymethyl)glutathione dehydrogenase / alcohol dehydrogenase